MSIQMLQQRGSRRNLLKTATAASTFAALKTNFAWSQVSDEIRVGVVGCGSRGNGAGWNVMEAAQSLGLKAKITAVADVFDLRAQTSAKKWNIDKERVFVGFDAYKNLLATDVEMVILATPPVFRPDHFEATVAAGKHAFIEKPVGVDPAGVRRMLAASEIAAQKKLAVVAGTHRRHWKAYVEMMARIHDGAIGDILHVSVRYCSPVLWWNKRQPGMSDLEYQLSNWYHHIWLSGDQIVEQHVHTLDVANWVLDDHPVVAYAQGGRQVRDRIGHAGEIWDHFATEFQYASGARVTSMCRHWPQADLEVSESIVGTKGTALGTYGGVCSITSGNQTVKFGETGKNKAALGAYVQEHVDLIKSIKDGKPLNEGAAVSNSTLTAVMARMSAYTGKKVSWDFAMKESKLNLLPPNLTMASAPPPVQVPQPGVTELI